MKNKKTGWLAFLLALLIAVIPAVQVPTVAWAQTTEVNSGDAYVRYDPDNGTWTMGTEQIEKTVQLSEKNFLLTSFINKLTGREYIQGGQVSDEFGVRVDTMNSHFTGTSKCWEYDDYETTVGEQGELLLRITFHNDLLGVTRNYQILPDTGVIEEWTEYQNLSGTEMDLSEMRMIRQKIMSDDAADVDLYRMTGDKNSTMGYHKMQPPNPLAENAQYDGSGADYWHPFAALRNRETGEGVFFTWDYTGKWSVSVGNYTGRIFVQAKTEAKAYTALADQETVTTPAARTGVFLGDLDDMGNQILDYQYRYRWENTNPDFLNLIRFGGYGSDPETILDKTNTNRYLGGDMVWIDDGWQTAIGDWEWKEPVPVSEYQEYIRKNQQVLGLWLVPWGAAAGSALASSTPDWCINIADKKGGLKVELPEVSSWIKNMLDERQQQFGTFMLKTDYNHYKSTFRRAEAVADIIADFKTRHPETGLHLCSDGGGLLNPGTVNYSELLLLQDGTPGYDDGYWVSLLYPIDKILTANGRGNLGTYSKSNRALLSSAMTVAGEVNAPAEEKELLRRDCDLYRYLKTQGVMGRYVKVYRPRTDTDRSCYFIQKMSPEGTKGYMTVRFDPADGEGPLTVYPKGLLEEEQYTVSSLEGGTETVVKSGREWMEQGIALSELYTGEVLFFNLEGRPGTDKDKTPPGAPTDAAGDVAAYMGFEGMEMQWDAGSDDNWISYYEIEKNGVSYDKVSKGTFYFDKEGKPGDVYRVRTVDGSGNTSDYVTVKLEVPEPDDTPVDKEQLSAVYAEAEKKTESDYTAGSWTVFAEARQKASEVLQDEKAEQWEVDAAREALEQAMADLTEREPEPTPTDTPKPTSSPAVTDTPAVTATPHPTKTPGAKPGTSGRRPGRDNPKTGDFTSWEIWLAAAGICLAGGIVLSVRKKRKSE